MMGSAADLLMLAPLAPLLAVLLAVAAPIKLARGAVVAAAVPGMLAGWLAAGEALRAPGLLFGMQLGLEPALGAAMSAVAGVWFCAALHGAGSKETGPRARRYLLCFALAMAGQMGAFVARDLAGFYAAFACLSFAGYGMVAHADSDAARRAGRIYVSFVVLGELALFAAFVLIADARGGDLALPRDSLVAPPMLAWWLLAVGFGVKAGLVPLHGWLPLAHPVAPVPASAALSGATLKAGLVGLMALAPLGLDAPPGFGMTLLVLGLTGAFGGALLAALAGEAKTALAWSSVSQMGLALTLYGAAQAGLAEPGAATAALALFIVHHALAKGALFLAMAPGLSRGAGLVLMVLPALSLTGAPLTLGYAAKAASGAALAPGMLGMAFDVAALGTALAMVRVLVLTAGRAQVPGGRHAAAGFGLLVLVLGTLPLLADTAQPTGALAIAKAAAPALLAASLGWLVWRLRWQPPAIAQADPMALLALPLAGFAVLRIGVATGVAAILALESRAAWVGRQAMDRLSLASPQHTARATWSGAATAMAVIGGALLWLAL